MATIIVGSIFAVLLLIAGKKALGDMKKGKCAGCSGCGPNSKGSCQIDFDHK